MHRTGETGEYNRSLFGTDLSGLSGYPEDYFRYEHSTDLDIIRNRH